MPRKLRGFWSERYNYNTKECGKCTYVSQRIPGKNTFLLSLYPTCEAYDLSYQPVGTANSYIP